MNIRDEAIRLAIRVRGGGDDHKARRWIYTMSQLEAEQLIREGLKAAVAEERARWMECAKYDTTFPEKPLFQAWDRSALDRLRVAIEKEMEEAAAS